MLPLDHDLGAADRDAGDGAGIAADDDRAGVHVVGHAPADIIVDLETGAVAQGRRRNSRPSRAP